MSQVTPKNRRSGFSLAEILVGLIIFTLICVVVGKLLLTDRRSVESLEQHIRAHAMAQSIVEVVGSLNPTDLNTFFKANTDDPAKKWYFGPAPERTWINDWMVQDKLQAVRIQATITRTNPPLNLVLPRDSAIVPAASQLQDADISITGEVDITTSTGLLITKTFTKILKNSSCN